ncbi:MAG: hypothetical protein Q8P15_03450 [Nanoarchaeota archaeon]|nr:hypothetical protein [Nanoarchaeota archaeon]
MVDEMTKEKIKEAYISKDKNKMAEEIFKLLDWKFTLRIWWIHDNKEKKIFDFLRKKKRTSMLVLDNNLMYSVEALIMDRDFFKKYLSELFFPEKYNYDFEDSEKKIEITHDGDVKIRKE